MSEDWREEAQAVGIEPWYPSDGLINGSAEGEWAPVVVLGVGPFGVLVRDRLGAIGTRPLGIVIPDLDDAATFSEARRRLALTFNACTQGDGVEAGTLFARADEGGRWRLQVIYHHQVPPSSRCLSMWTIDFEDESLGNTRDPRLALVRAWKLSGYGPQVGS